MTSVPTTIDYLLRILRADPDLAAVEVHDGPWIDRPDSAAVLVVGWVPEEGEAVEWSTASSDLGDGQAQSFTLQGLVSHLDGDSDMKTARDTADGLLETLRGAISRDRTLGGAVSRAELNTLGATPDQGEDGAEWAIRWVITARVF